MQVCLMECNKWSSITAIYMKLIFFYQQRLKDKFNDEYYAKVILGRNVFHQLI